MAFNAAKRGGPVIPAVRHRINAQRWRRGKRAGWSAVTPLSSNAGWFGGWRDPAGPTLGLLFVPLSSPIWTLADRRDGRVLVPRC